MANASVRVQDFRRGIDSMVGDIERLADRAKSVGRSLSLFLTVPILGIGLAIGQAGVQMDSLTRGLTAVMHSAARAQDELVNLKEVAKLPGLGFREAIEGSIRLQAAGFSAGLARRALLEFGNALATVGKGKADLDGVTLALSQIAAKGKIMAQDINQIQERVPQIRVAMRAAFGTADTEALQKLGLGAQQFVEGVLTQLAKLPRVTGGVQNDFENLSDAVFQLRASLAQQLLPAVTPIVRWLGELAAKLKDADPATVRMVISILALTAALGPAVVVIGSIVGSVGTLFTAFGSLGALLTGPVGAVLIATAALFIAFRANLFGARTAADNFRAGMGTSVPPMRSFIGVMSDAARAAGVFAAVLIGRLVGSLVASTAATFAKLAAARAAAVQELQSAAAALASARAQQQQTGAVAANVQARLTLLRTQGAGIASANALRGTEAALAVAEIEEAAAANAATAAEARHTAALAAVSIGSRAAAAGMGALDAAMAFFGGPIGLAITVALGAVALAFVNTGQKALEAGQDARAAAEEFKAALLTMDEATVQAKFGANVQTTARLTEQIESLRTLLDQQKRQGPLTASIRVERGPAQQVNTELGQLVAHNEASLAALERLRGANIIQERALSDELARRQDLRRQMEETTGQLAGGPAAAAGADKLAGTIDHVNDGLRHMRDLLRFQGALRDEDLTGAFGDQLKLVDELGDRVDTLSDQLTKLGSRAPHGARDMLTGLQEQLRSAREELGRMAEQWNTQWARVVGETPAINVRVNLQPVGVVPLGSLQTGPATTRPEPQAIRDLSLASDELSNLTDGLGVTGRALVIFGELAYVAGHGLADFARSVDREAKQQLRSAVSGAASTLSQLTPLGLLAYAVSQAMEPLLPAIMALLAPVKILAQAFGAALLPILQALFPVFKLVTIAATYIGQVFFTVAAAVLRVIAFFVDAVATIIKTLGKIINAITPFANPGNPLIRAGEALQKVAHTYREVADGFGDAVDALGDAREQIKDLSWEDAVSGVDKLGDAAGKAADSMYNVPDAWRMLGYRVWQTMDARAPGPALADSPAAAMNGYAPASTVSNTATQQYVDSRQSNATTVINQQFDVTVQGSTKSAAQLFDELLGEGKRRARVQYGDPTRWAEVQ